MPVADAKNNLVFVSEELNTADTLINYAKGTLPNPISDRALQETADLKQQAGHYESTYQLAEPIQQVRTRHRKFELLEIWLNDDSGHNETYETAGSMKKGLPDVLHDFLYNLENRNLKRQIVDLYSLSRNLVNEILGAQLYIALRANCY